MSRLLALVLAALVALPLLVATAAPDRSAIARGVAYVRTTQQPDGGFGPAGQTFDAILALRAAGFDANTMKATSGATPADFLRANAAAQSKPASAAKAALAASSLGLNPRNVNGTDLIANIEGGYDSATGKYAEDDFSQGLAMIGLACTGNPVPNSAILVLRGTQLQDGGWGFGGFADADTTAIAMQALLAAGIPASDADIQEAIAYLKATQLADGGWGFAPESNTSSTAFALQALLAAGIDPATLAKNGKTPTAYLLSQQSADGSFAGFDPAFATNQVLPALAERAYCLVPVTPLQPASAFNVPVAAPAPPNTGTGLAPLEGGASLPAVVGIIAVAALGMLAFRRTIGVRR